ncbi:hypothetical protein [Thioalkalivibrio sulfidiphilus]|uniref:Transmembrane protein n=1 Tax=Thioalkalivibrio sulfidiphilus (strain HL-EbGR7) TaxID=396588 RepID=B8GUL8_THISH|nr:hypothetical protein [Thioalkalivibrio sulfidiphilus]ACL73338.1 conserved hypothetical protein [Thioalkalivibrio sulfidiphilus HL-EbGr7]
MDQLERRRHLHTITRRLIILAGLSLVLSGIIFAAAFLGTGRLMLSWLCFQCGIIGGFVSIQQRLKDIQDDELQLLAESWFSVLLIPVYGGIFALVLYVLFIAQLVGGQLFPSFHIPAFSVPPSSENIHALLTETLPASGPDLAKLIFWSFVAGFSERFVPQVVQGIVQRGSDEGDKGKGKSQP